ncbi:transcriptional regulator VisN [Pararhizobium mangrovi]|uniref:Helix-turn-helix transcriptional regulator n=1 Tax=Pararhizobium mangrovi TaxID=2590452 RepID=A0A506TZL0_9HYPH|nr:helix-turn-helix transcriptional regulator [Pararhizobium mangrovi]TPW26184.1 helix-turn-helix transcriptional regulator [Pararhizobium mangrovi]
MMARAALLEELETLAVRDTSSGMDRICAYAGAAGFLLARCDGSPDDGLSNVVASDWPFDLVRRLGLALLAAQARKSELDRCLAILQPVVEHCGEEFVLPSGIDRRLCVVPFNAGTMRMVVAFLLPEGATPSRERLGDAALLAAYFVEPGAGVHEPDHHPDLTEREIECLAWIAQGKTSEEIAMIIGISRNTVNNYITGIMRKTATRTRSEAIALATRRHLI